MKSLLALHGKNIGTDSLHMVIVLTSMSSPSIQQSLTAFQILSSCYFRKASSGNYRCHWKRNLGYPQYFSQDFCKSATTYFYTCLYLSSFSACVTSIVRLYYAVRALETGDITYNIAMMGLWTHAEIAVGIICSCLPVLPIFFQTIWPKISSRIKTSLSTLNRFKDFKPSVRLAKGIDDPSNSSSNSTGTLHPTYELQGRYHSSGMTEIDPTKRHTSTISDLNAQTIRPLPIFPGESETDTTGMGDWRNKNQILKTVTVETVQEDRDSCASDLERQGRAPWWSKTGWIPESKDGHISKVECVTNIIVLHCFCVYATQEREFGLSKYLANGESYREDEWHF